MSSRGLGANDFFERLLARANPRIPNKSAPTTKAPRRSMRTSESSCTRENTEISSSSAVGVDVGNWVMQKEGHSVGAIVGVNVGEAVGALVGELVGESVGSGVGKLVGLLVVGDVVGFAVGSYSSAITLSG